MKTDLQQLKRMDCAMIVVAIFGLSILATEFFLMLPASMQTKISLSTEKIFDISVAMDNEVNGIKLGMREFENFYENFYIAFESTLAAPDIVLAIEKKASESGSIADNISEVALGFSGYKDLREHKTKQGTPMPMVLGATIEYDFASIAPKPSSVIKKEQPEKMMDYISKEISQKIIIERIPSYINKIKIKN